MPDIEFRRLDRQAVIDTIERLLQARREGATLCPSEVARALVGETGPWRRSMPQIREIAADLARDGRVRVTRRGVEVDATTPGGPIRLGNPHGD